MIVKTKEDNDTPPYDQKFLQLHPPTDFSHNEDLFDFLLTNPGNTNFQEKKKLEYPCTLCSKKYKSKARLEIHIRTHSGYKPFGCSKCGRKFNEKGNLSIHMRIHSGAKPYKCTNEGCTKMFRAYGHLSDHLKRHLNIRPFTCDICKSSFGRRNTLKTHMMVHTGEKPYECSVCCKKFSEKGNMKTHMKIHMKNFGKYKLNVDSTGKIDGNSFENKSVDMDIHIIKTYEYSYCAQNLNSSINTTRFQSKLIQSGREESNLTMQYLKPENLDCFSFAAKHTERFDQEKYFDREESLGYYGMEIAHEIRPIMTDNTAINAIPFPFDYEI